MSSFLAVKVSLRVAREEITKQKDRSLLGVKFKISDEHPRPLHMGVPPTPWDGISLTEVSFKTNPAWSVIVA